MPKFNRQNSGHLHWFLVISSPLTALLLVYTTGTAFSGLSLWVLYTAALISLSRSPLTKESKSVDTEPRAPEPAVVSTENIRMTYSSVVPAIMSLVAVTTILALDGIFGVSLLPIMSFEELAASVWRCCTSPRFEDSLCESSGLDGWDEQAASPPIPYHELAHV